MKIDTVVAVLLALTGLWSFADATKLTTNLVDGCYVCNGEFVRVDTNATRIAFPNTLRDISPIPVYYGANGWCAGCSDLCEVVIPECVRTIGFGAFRNCGALTNVVISEGVVYVAPMAFSGCCSLKKIVFPKSLQVLGVITHYDIPPGLEEIHFLGNAPDPTEASGFTDALHSNISGALFDGCRPDLRIYVKRGTTGWTGIPGKQGLPDRWPVIETFENSRQIMYEPEDEIENERIEPGFVTIITEVKSCGAVSVPEAWSANYVEYKNKYGDNFAKSLMKPTGKIDGAGNAMCVWQDYVAGTDPTDENDRFTASVTIVDGKPVISYSPELSDSETAMRVYRIWGKVRLTDADWIDVSDGNNADYNFFKVSVEMR